MENNIRCSAGIALHKLATLHEALGQPHEAAHYYQQNLTRIDAARLQGSDRQDALLFLANYKKASICLSVCMGSPWQKLYPVSTHVHCM